MKKLYSKFMNFFKEYLPFLIFESKKRLIKKYLISVFVIVFLIDLTFRNIGWQNFLKYLTFSLGSEYFFNSTGLFFYNHRLFFKILFWSIILIIFAFFTFSYLYSKRCKYKYEINANQRLIPYLYLKLIEFLKNESKKTFVINGEWGSGKTYALRRFTNEYFKYDKQKPIYISCFGISTREQIEKLIKDSYQKNDETVKSKFNLLIKSIPILGETLHNMFKPKYDFKYMKKGSLFIFDDFERIAQCYQYKNPNRIYKSYINDITFKKEDILELSELNLQNTLKAHVANFELEVFKLTENTFNKFNTVSGVINDLAENYNMKVIVVCNKDTLDPRIFNEIFHNKMSSIIYEFESQASDEVIKSVLSTTLSNIILNKSIHNALKDFLTQENDNIISFWNCCKNKNLRHLNNIIISFINVINFLGLDLTKDILGDIFYSIFLKHIKAYCTMSDTLVIYEKLNLADNLFAALSDSFTNCFSVFYNKKNILEFLKNYIYVGENISNYWHSGLKLNYSEITTDLEYFHKIKKDHLILKLYKNENNFDIIASVNSVDCFRLEDLAYCLNKVSFYWEDIDNTEYYSLNTPDLTPIIENIISPKCIINNNNDICLKELYNLLHSYSIKGNIICLLNNNRKLLFKLFKRFSTNVNYNNINLVKFLENGYDFYDRLNRQELIYYESSHYKGYFIYLFDLFNAFLHYPQDGINILQEYDSFQKSLEKAEIMLDPSIRKFFI